MELHCLQVAGPITEEAEKWGVCNRAVHGVLVDKDMKYEARIILGTLSKDVFERSTSTGSVAFSLLICLDANKLVLLSFCSLLKTIYPRVSTKPLPNDAKSPLPVDVRRSKTLLLKLPIIILHLHIMISWNGRFSFAFNSVAASIRKLWKIK